MPPSTQTGEVVPAQLAMHAAHLARRARLWKRPARPRAVAPLQLAQRDLQVVEVQGPAWGAPVNFFSSPNPKNILRLVSLKHGLPVAEIIGLSRKRHVVAARYEAIALIYTHCRQVSLPALGRIFTRDHTTILHALRKMRSGGNQFPPTYRREPSSEEVTKTLLAPANEAECMGDHLCNEQVV
jgi:hypothetical protein